MSLSKQLHPLPAADAGRNWNRYLKLRNRSISLMKPVVNCLSLLIFPGHKLPKEIIYDIRPCGFEIGWHFSLVLKQKRDLRQAEVSSSINQLLKGYLLHKETQHDTGCHSRANHSRNVWSHRVHQQVVSRVTFQSFVLNDPGTVRNSRNTCCTN